MMWRDVTLPNDVTILWLLDLDWLWAYDYGFMFHGPWFMTLTSLNRFLKWDGLLRCQGLDHTKTRTVRFRQNRFQPNPWPNWAKNITVRNRSEPFGTASRNHMVWAIVGNRQDRSRLFPFDILKNSWKPFQPLGAVSDLFKENHISFSQFENCLNLSFNNSRILCL